ncbi:MAG: cyclic nucleotide-binding/CBS domain-containing protein, partial [Candidatus Micrarchaeia archaeon]
ELMNVKEAHTIYGWVDVTTRMAASHLKIFQVKYELGGCMRAPDKDLLIDARKTSDIAIREIMSSPVVTARENASVREIAKKMKNHDIDTVVIVNKENEPIGMVTEGDIVRRLLSKKRSLWFTKAKHVMSKPVLTANTEAKIEDVAKYMATKRIKRLCIVDESNKLVGIVTQTDIIENTNYLIGLLRELLDSGYGEVGASELETI